MSQLPGNYDITIKQGAKWALTFELSTNDVAKDLTDFSAYMEIRPDANSDKVYETLTLGSEITITAATGTIELVLTKAQTAALQFRKAVYDIFLRDLNNLDDDVALLDGNVYLVRRITRWT